MYLERISFRLLRRPLRSRKSIISCFSSDTKAEDSRKSDETTSRLPKNPWKDVYSARNQPTNGAIYDKKPFKVELKAGKSYTWCLCGQSKSQPFCDGTHRNVFLKIPHRPIRFTVEETKDYWLCNCKQTGDRPFCDGTHLREDIQEKK